MPTPRFPRLLLIFTVTALFAAYATLVLTKHITQDEGVFLTIGNYINEGLLPYQDFFDHKPPAIYVLFALLFKLFGAHLLVVKICLILSMLGSSILVHRIAEIAKQGSGWYASGIFLFLMTQFEGYFAIAEPFLLLPLLYSVWVLLYKPKQHWYYLAAGISLAIAVLFKQTVILSAIPLLIIAAKLARKHALLFAGGFALPLAVFGIWLIDNNLIAEAFRQIIMLTLTSYPREAFSTVVTSLRGTFLWTLPVWVLLLLAACTTMPQRYVLWSLVLLPLPAMIVRHYPHYWVQLLPFVAVIAAAALQSIGKRTAIVAVMIYCLVIGGGKIVQEGIPHYRVLKDQIRAAQELQTEEAEYLLAENQFAAFYFLLPQQPLNKYLYLTEITDAEEAEQHTITDLKSHHSVLILWPMDANYAYAKDLQALIANRPAEESAFESLGMRAIRYISQ